MSAAAFLHTLEEAVEGLEGGVDLRDELELGRRALPGRLPGHFDFVRCLLEVRRKAVQYLPGHLGTRQSGLDGEDLSGRGGLDLSENVVKHAARKAASPDACDLALALVLHLQRPLQDHLHVLFGLLDAGAQSWPEIDELREEAALSPGVV